MSACFQLVKACQTLPTSLFASLIVPPSARLVTANSLVHDLYGGAV